MFRFFFSYICVRKKPFPEISFRSAKNIKNLLKKVAFYSLINEPFVLTLFCTQKSQLPYPWTEHRGASGLSHILNTQDLMTSTLFGTHTTLSQCLTHRIQLPYPSFGHTPRGQKHQPYSVNRGGSYLNPLLNNEKPVNPILHRLLRNSKMALWCFRNPHSLETEYESRNVACDVPSCTSIFIYFLHINLGEKWSVFSGDQEKSETFSGQSLLELMSILVSLSYA
jgi:hypothetical protein